MANKEEREMKKYQIEVSCDSNEGAEFVACLNAQGHNAKLATTTDGYIDGVSTTDNDANEIMNDLWNAYCNQ